MEVLRKVFEAILHHGQLLNPAKMKLFRSEVEFVGLKISQEGVRSKEDDKERICQ